MRLLTRSDFDGLVCGVLLAEAGVIDSYHFVHPKDVQDGLVQVTTNDVLTNVPFIPGCGLWFDHHSSEMERLKLMKEHHFRGTSAPSPSCARLVYNYFGGRERFRKFEESGLMDAVDRSDSGQVTMEEVMNPRGWMLVSFVMDARTGLDRYSDYRITIQELMKDMIRFCRVLPVDEVLKLPDVKERIDRYFEQEKAYEEMIRSSSAVHGNVLLIDLHEVKEIVSGNRFKEYVLFPSQNVSLRILWGRGRHRMVFSCGHSIFNRTCRTDVGSLLLKYGGGGHKMVGTCQVPSERWELVRDELIAALRG